MKIEYSEDFFGDFSLYFKVDEKKKDLFYNFLNHKTDSFQNIELFKYLTRNQVLFGSIPYFGIEKNMKKSDSIFQDDLNNTIPELVFERIDSNLIINLSQIYRKRTRKISCKLFVFKLNKKFKYSIVDKKLSRKKTLENIFLDSENRFIFSTSNLCRYYLIPVYQNSLKY